MLPLEDEKYMPPMSIRVRDKRSFGRKPVIRHALLKSLRDFM